MAIAVFGISGRTGAALVEVAQARGLQLVGLTRRVADAPPPASVRLLTGELTDPVPVCDVVKGTEATICVFGPRPPYSEVFCAQATATIITAMRMTGTGRLLCQTGAMIGALPPTVSRPMRWMARRFARSRPEVAADRAEQERIVRASGLAWTLVKPPRLREDAGRGPVRAGPELPVGLLASIGRGALAGFLLDEAMFPRYVGQAVYVRS